MFSNRRPIQSQHEVCHREKNTTKVGLHLQVETLACEDGPSHTGQHIQGLAVQSTAKCQMQKVVALGKVSKSVHGTWCCTSAVVSTAGIADNCHPPDSRQSDTWMVCARRRRSQGDKLQCAVETVYRTGTLYQSHTVRWIS